MPADEKYPVLIRQAVSGDTPAIAIRLFNHHTMVTRHIESKMSCLMKQQYRVDDILRETLREAFRAIRQKNLPK